MACNNCYNGCSETVSDKCVKYTGLDVPALGIENGDSLASVEQAIFNFLVPVLDGTGVKPIIDDQYICEIIRNYLPTCSECEGFTLNEILTAIIRTACRLKENVDSIFATLTVLNANYNIGCLTGVSPSSDTHDVLQATINKVCQLGVEISDLEDYVNNTFVKIADIDIFIQAYLNTQTNLNLKMIPYVAVPYFGPLTNFDVSGAGQGVWTKIYLCNGDNGTPDLRGRTVVGATTMPGGTMSPVVNPGGFNPNYGLGLTAGSNSVTLDISQIPTHSHTNNSTITIDPHFHRIFANQQVNTPSNLLSVYPDRQPALFGAGNGNADRDYEIAGSTVNATAGKTSSETVNATINVTINPSGQGQAHSNVQPSIGAYYIMYIP